MELHQPGMLSGPTPCASPPASVVETERDEEDACVGVGLTKSDQGRKPLVRVCIHPHLEQGRMPLVATWLWMAFSLYRWKLAVPEPLLKLFFLFCFVFNAGRS